MKRARNWNRQKSRPAKTGPAGPAPAPMLELVSKFEICIYLIFRVLTERFLNHHRPRKIVEGAEMNERELNLCTDSGRKEREVEKTEGERSCLLMCYSNIPSCSHMQDTRSSNYKLPLSTTTAIANKT